MSMIQKSPLETAVLERFHKLYEAQGFPSAESVAVIARKNTGGGRYVQLECDARVQFADGYVDLGGGFIEMKDVPNGLMAVGFIKGSRLVLLEITVYGGDHWDGEEREWRIV